MFAIAITLLVRDIRVPVGEFRDLWSGIAHAWPAYLGYVTSFLTIGGIWLVHPTVAALCERARDLVLLMAVAFCRFRAGRWLRRSETRRARGGDLLRRIAAGDLALVRRPVGDRGTRTPPLKPEVTEQEMDALRRASRPNVGFYAGVTPLAILAPRVAASVRVPADRGRAVLGAHDE